MMYVSLQVTNYFGLECREEKKATLTRSAK